jgi:stress-induced morphogen
MKAEKIKSLLEVGIKDAIVHVSDNNGSCDHFKVEVKSPAFRGLDLVEQHRLVYQVLDQYMLRDIHALQIKTNIN